MSFSNPITGGQGALIRPAVKSPNYVPGQAGWSINRDGSAEFNNVVIRGGETIGGSFLVYNGTPAAGNLIGSWSGASGTDPYGNTFPAGLETGVAGMPQILLQATGSGAEILLPTNNADESTSATVFTQGQAGATTGIVLLQITGPSVAARADLYKILLGSSSYNGTSSAADLTFAYVDAGGTEHDVLALTSGASITPAATTAVPVTVNGLPSQSADLMDFRDGSGNLLAFISPTGRLTVQPVNTAIVPLTVNLPTGSAHHVADFQVNAVDVTHIDNAGNIVLSGALVKGAAGTAYTWQSVSSLLVAGWATGSSASVSYAPLQYRFLAEDTVWLYGALHATANAPSTTPFTLPAGPPTYRPADTLAGLGAMVSTASTDVLKLVGRLNVASSGQVTLGGFTITTGDNFYFDHVFRLGNVP